MSLAEGTRLGAYEIIGPLGAGGMGEVYRAKDLKLGRDVTIKTLPAALASDKDHLARFEREAKLLAALSPDGRFLAFASDESGESEIYVRPFPEVDSGRWQVSTSGGQQPVWSADGDRIFYLDQEQGIMVSDVTTEPVFARGLPRLWMPGHRLPVS